MATLEAANYTRGRFRERVDGAIRQVRHVKEAAPAGYGPLGAAWMRVIAQILDMHADADLLAEVDAELASKLEETFRIIQLKVNDLDEMVEQRVKSMHRGGWDSIHP
jgi:hypothetical protein